MASQGPHNTSGYSSGQAQMRRNDLNQQPSNFEHQDLETNFFQETGTQVKNMAQGAAEIGKGAALGAVSMAKGAATGAANLAYGAADAVKHTFGMDSTTTTTDHNTSNWPSSTDYHPAGAGNTNWPSGNSGNRVADTTDYPNLMDDLGNDTTWSSHLNNPSSRNI